MAIPNDFTVYLAGDTPLPPHPATDSTAGPPEMEAPSGSTASRARTVRFDLQDTTSDTLTSVTARALICRCFRGRHLSVTCRAGTGNAQQDALPWKVDASIQPRGTLPVSESDENPQIAASTNELLDELWINLRIEDRPLTGLIVIAGRTGSGKSDIARAFTTRFLDHAKKQGGRRPHLLTYEDPIEKLIAQTPADAAARGFDYTPREKLFDAPNLRASTKDALRQTPTVFYVGETRDDQDWRELLRFAGTGHLTITTGHAGSLVETMSQILHAERARSPTERSRVAGRIAALVHLRPYPVDTGKVLIPAFWFRTPRAISAFTAEGLGALFPNRPGPADKGASYGRAHAVHSLKYLQNINGLLPTAVKWDLRGE